MKARLLKKIRSKAQLKIVSKEPYVGNARYMGKYVYEYAYVVESIGRYGTSDRFKSLISHVANLAVIDIYHIIRKNDIKKIKKEKDLKKKRRIEEFKLKYF